MAKKVKRLYRAKKKDSIVGGVCAGIAEYMNVDPTIVRLIWAASTVLWGLGVWAYAVGWIIIPRK